ncbi:pyridoxal phosphate-dependent decarboxylase family protein [Dinghuibacter silviterrae]|uniref:Glutamate/tyrosine decarboxylase-like PLP-dependent enzyme n=1 Tax=Dinghuibacter silviterrae TaxID=1539049 RepID=A0A4R8DUB4_9BACT|nr:pyridoxal-dependent decarboxylase [Dinghuibacter silviterrae]TDX01954.1 glutamate/tyrosine decarboxylase-like PLP-dependent enzyme [Dinghuibacter silviterrae]
MNDDKTLDPHDWEQARALGHRVVDDAIDYLRSVRERPVWTPIPGDIKETYSEALPWEPTPVDAVYETFLRTVFPYTTGNIHPRFFSWVHGTGTFTGALADFMAAVMNPNCAIGEHSPMYIDQQVLGWCKEMMGFTPDAGGLLVSGGSVANLTALAVAREWAIERYAAAGAAANAPGAATGATRPLIAYGSTETHQCVSKALRLLGLPELCALPADEHFRLPPAILRARIREDRAAGKLPFCIVATAGTVNTGAVDPLEELRDIAWEEGLWLHIDGAFGALARLSPTHADELEAIGRADSLAFDLHKWMYMPYEVGCVLIRDLALQRRTFAASAHYLLTHDRGLASGPDAASNRGIELSRGFKALKVWMSIKEHGIKKYASMIGQNIAQAAYLGRLIAAHPDLELAAPVTMNVVCFRYRDVDVDNKELLMRLHESGVAAPSYTLIHGRYALRVAITNHRTRMEDMEVMVAKVREIGAQLAAARKC